MNQQDYIITISTGKSGKKKNTLLLRSYNTKEKGGNYKEFRIHLCIENQQMFQEKITIQDQTPIDEVLIISQHG